MKHIKTVFAVAALSVLAACSSSKEPELDYHTPGVKKTGDTLVIPPDLTGIAQNDRYTLPAGTGAVRASQLEDGATVAGTGDAVLPQVKNMHIEREGSQRWLTVGDKSPQEIWPLLKAFWQENGFIIDQENPATGFMQTQWAENRATIPTDPVRRLFQRVGLGGMYSSSFRDRFVVRMERTAKGGTAVTFSHQGMEEMLVGKDKDTTQWQPRASDPDLEAQLLARFMMRLGADQDTVQKELLQKSSVAGELAKLDGDRLLVSGTHERNVYRLSLTLDRVGLTVQNYDAANNTFTVQPADIEADAVSNAKPGFFSRLFGSKPQAAEKKPLMQVKITPQGKATDVVTLHHADGSAYRGKDGKDILDRLWRELR
ncbi:MAG: outer membrane protein assembly factor BamC [Neisseria sp.]|nr:outer membrane protein assembly factor BamC [Neisseria sp.]